MKDIFFVEVTDTFGGEANYCWVHRYRVRAATAMGAARKVAQYRGEAIRNAMRDTRWDVVGACICYFVDDDPRFDLEAKVLP